MRRSLKSRFTRFLPALLLIAAAAPARAGIHYKATSTTETPQGPQRMNVEAWVDGDKARIEFRSSDNPFMKRGTYILTRDGGRKILLVDPDEKTYGELDLAAMLGSMGALLGGMGPVLKLEISDPKVEKLSEEDGPEIVGLPTRHVKFRTAYQMKMKIMGFGRATSVVSEEDLWLSDRLVDKAMGVWLQAERKTGNPDLDKLIATERSKVTGIPLKTASVVTSTGNGRSATTHQSMEVTALDRFTAAPVSFDVPAG
ncbi:MAG TPA: hypothetical protein VN783_01765, partial [Thermoanaerobaculia bacterium]|nr:hypothetical protein [Thermoanaerobaculia bacterium]